MILAGFAATPSAEFSSGFDVGHLSLEASGTAPTRANDTYSVRGLPSR